MRRAVQNSSTSAASTNASFSSSGRASNVLEMTQIVTFCSFEPSPLINYWIVDKNLKIIFGTYYRSNCARTHAGLQICEIRSDFFSDLILQLLGTHEIKFLENFNDLNLFWNRIFFSLFSEPRLKHGSPVLNVRLGSPPAVHLFDYPGKKSEFWKFWG